MYHTVEANRVELESKAIDYRIEQRKKQNIQFELSSSDEDECCFLYCLCTLMNKGVLSPEKQDEIGTGAVVGT